MTNLPTDLQNDLIEVFDKIREQKIGNKIGEYDCANDEALKWIEEAYKKNLIKFTI